MKTKNLISGDLIVIKACITYVSPVLNIPVIFLYRTKSYYEDVAVLTKKGIEHVRILVTDKIQVLSAMKDAK